VTVGERIQFRAPLKAQKIPNGALGRITTLDPEHGQVTVALDRGPSFSTTLQELWHIEYGYATTSHSSQGATIDRVVVNIDTKHSAALVNQQQFYVSISRARQDARIFTNTRDELAQAVSRSWPKATALDAIAPAHDALKYVKQRTTGRNRGTTRQPEGPQIDAAQLVNHRQTEWRREHQRTRPEQMVGHALTERRGDRVLFPPGHTDRTEQKPELHKGMGYRR